MSQVSIHKMSIKSEAELAQLLADNLESVEEGLQVLGHQVPAGRGFIDLLVADQRGALVAFVLSKSSDEQILVQALERYDFLRDNIERYSQTYPGYKINPMTEPKLILVASDYSASTATAARYIGIPLVLYICLYLDVGGMRGLHLRQIEIRDPRTFPKESTGKVYKRGC